MLKMVDLLRFRSSDSVERLRALIALSYNLAMTVSAAESEDDTAMMVTDVVPRIEKLANAVERMRPPSHVPSHERGSEPPAAVRGLEDQIVTLVASIENVVVGSIVPEMAPHALPIEHKSGFFSADAFRNPDHVRFAAKGATAVMVCYLTFTLLDWPGIHTAMLTCFIVGLTTIGETLHEAHSSYSGLLCRCRAGDFVNCLYSSAYNLNFLAAVADRSSYPTNSMDCCR